MQQHIIDFLQQHGFRFNQFTLFLTAISIIILTAVIVHVILHRLVLVRLIKFAQKSTRLWSKVVTENQLFSRMAFTVQGLIVILQTTFWIHQGVKTLVFLMIVAKVWVLVYTLLSIFSFLDIVLKFASKLEIAARLPLGGIFQGFKLLAALLFGIFILSVLIDKSPLILISGLGAMAAVIMLVFKDSILGLSAGVQLSANNMMRVHDWIQMPKYGADGIVMDIGLTTVKVRNFDNTVTMIPTYALVSDSFTNWRGMQESGGRRIKRSVYIDVTTVHYVTDEEKNKILKSNLLQSFLNLDKAIKNEDQQKIYIDFKSYLSTDRPITNLSLYRIYLDLYLQNHPRILNQMIYMVRQMAPDGTGLLPLEIYGFSNTVVWKEYEAIQSEIFEHAYAVIDEFFLSAYQNPSGNSSSVTIFQGDASHQ